jgi:predicted N-formylglutamate amidohydrolase
MTGIADCIEGGNGMLLIADHASNRVPPGVELGIPSRLLDDHIAVDIGVAALSRALAERLGCAAVLARWSRLVVDLNRDSDDENVIPTLSDGHSIPGNASLGEAERGDRIERFWMPYHALIDARIERLRPTMLVSVHSFTPQLASYPEEERPWQVGILYNRDQRAARLAIELLIAGGVTTGDNQPYSGLALNATMNRHAEARGLPYLGIEVRQDLIDAPAGIAAWADRLAPVIAAVGAALA